MDLEHPGARGLPQLDYPLWRQTAHNPVLMLRDHLAEMLEARRRRSKFLATYDAAIAALDARAQRETRGGEAPPGRHGPIAYFSAEFALHQSLPIYAGGLGVLAGDHCKEASDLGMPLIGVGFMYPQGYFHQMVTAEGWQQESTNGSTGPTRRSSPPSRRTARRASSPSRSAIARCWCRCGGCGSAA